MKADIQDVRPSPIAGSWYPANPEKLRQTISGYLADVEPHMLAGKINALIVPHAGHIYSGKVAACAYKLLSGLHFERIVIISPSHKYYPQAILTTAHQAYATPLGRIPVAHDLVDAISQDLESTLGMGISPIAYDQEHSLEIQLPFLQVVLQQTFELIPIMLRDQSPKTALALADSIAKVMVDRNALLIASSDLSHFHGERQANQLDQHILDAIAAFDPDALYQKQSRGEGEACGLGPMAAILWAARALGADHAEVVCHATSADVTGDTQSVVGYGAAVITSPF